MRGTRKLAKALASTTQPGVVTPSAKENLVSSYPVHEAIANGAVDSVVCRA